MAKKCIDADRLKQTIADNVYLLQDAFNSRDYGMFWTGGIEKAIDEQPAVDVVEVVRCKDCKHSRQHDDEFWIGVNLTLLCDFYDCYTENEGFCSKGERKDG